MNFRQLSLYSFILIALANPSLLWAARHHHPTPTPTETATDTPTPTPTPYNYTGPKLYSFDAMWGSKGSEPNQLNYPEDIAVGPDGRLFIADTGNNRVAVWTADGEPVTTFGTFGSQSSWRNPPQFNHPTGIFVYPNKQIYVADSLNSRIVVLDVNGMVVTTWGSPGTGVGQFNLPHAMAEDHYGNIWVMDTGNSRVQIFSNLGVFNSTWGSFGTDATANTLTAVMNQPRGLALNHIDQAIVADTGNFRMEVYNNGGIPVTIQGWYGEDGPNVFKDPSGVAVTPSGMAAIADGSGRVLFYNSKNGDFEYLGEWRAKDEILNANYAPRFRGIACDAQNRLYITDVQNDAVLRLKPINVPGAEPTPTPEPPTFTPTPVDSNPYGGSGFPIR